MAVLSTTLFFKNNRQYKAGSVVFDLLLSESHDFSSEITQYNIEDGSIISDHLRRLLFQGSLTAKVTNHSLQQGELITNRAQDAYDKLKQLWLDEELVDINVIYDVFKDVAITNISTARSSGAGEAIEFSISFQETNIVQLQEIVIVANVKLANMDSANNRQASPKLEVGKQQGVLR